jgi:hypothetical protein
MTTQGTTGPTGGWVQIGNVISQWGSGVVTTAGVTFNFMKAYTDNPPTVVISGMTGAPYEVTISKTGFSAKSSVGGTGTWHAIGT